MSRTRARHAGVLGAALAALIGLGMLFPSLVPWNEPAGADDPEEECASQVHFFADDVTGKNYFGPPLQGDTARERLDDLQSRYCVDPALVVAQAIDRQAKGLAGYEGFAGLDTDDKVVAKINELISDPDLWRATVARLIWQENSGSLKQESRSGQYMTLYMISRPGSVPLIRAASPDRTYTVLVITLPDGTELVIQVECGGQPRNETFPVPPLDKPKPPPKPPAQPPTTTTERQETTTTGDSGKGSPGTTRSAPPTTRPAPPTTVSTLPSEVTSPPGGNTGSTNPPTSSPPATPPPTSVPPGGVDPL